MYERGRWIFQSICHPQFLSHLWETALMPRSIKAGFCHWYVYACVCDGDFKWRAVPAIFRRGHGNEEDMIIMFCLFVFAVEV